MKKSINLLFLCPMLMGCVSPKKSTDSNVISSYIDDEKEIFVDDFEFRLDLDIKNSEKEFWFYLYTTSNKLEETNLTLKNGYIFRESNGAKYKVFNNETLYLENEIEVQKMFFVNIPTLLTEENYQFNFEVLGKSVKYYLYYNPENYFNVFYKVNNQIVQTDKVHKGEYAKMNYIYEDPNHFEYSRGWKGETKTVDSMTPIIEDTYLVPIMAEAVSYLTTSLDVNAWVSSINYVFKDKICVLRESYKDKPICLIHSFSNTLGIKDLFLPSSLVSVASRCFLYIENVCIHYPGTKNEWNSKIKYTDGFGRGTTLVFNSSFN